MVIFISSFTQAKRKPRSAQLIVIYQISSSKVYMYISSLIGQMPVSLAYLY